jgi:hypothetical protein
MIMHAERGTAAILVTIVSFVLLVAFAGPVVAEPASSAGVVETDGGPAIPFTFNWDVTLASKYLFQGIDYSNGEPVLQPQLAAGYGNLSAAVWFNHDLDQTHTNEYDVTLAYSWSVSSLSVGAGYMYLTYPHREGWDPSQEVLLDLALDRPLSPSLSFHYDFDAGKGSYSTFGLSHELPIAFQPVGLSASLYYQNNYYEATGFPALELNAGVERAVGPFTVTPSVSRVLTWENGDFRDDLASPSTWLFAVNVAQGF